MKQVILKPRKAGPFYARHPWVLASAVAHVEGEPADGEVVGLLSDKGKFIARGVYNSRSRIRVRLYSWNQAEEIDEVFWRRRLEAAIRLREQLGYNQPQEAARLVFSEGDNLSGLVVDRYAEFLVVQITALAMAQRLPQIAPMLVDLTRPKGIFVRTEQNVCRAEGIELQEGLYWGEPPPGPVIIEEHGLGYEMELAKGQKTGFYLDQRENRLAAARYFRNRRVLDMFCYCGGFGLTAAALGAREVLGIDISREAVALAEANAARNHLSNVRFQRGRAFQTLQALLDAGERFGGVVLDPPKFARSRRTVKEALQAYHWLNRLAIGLLEADGILVTCCCSGHVGREDFFKMLIGVAQQTGREIQILEQRGAAPDHPLNTACLDTEYLKCFICRVQ